MIITYLLQYSGRAISNFLRITQFISFLLLEKPQQYCENVLFWQLFDFISCDILESFCARVSVRSCPYSLFIQDHDIIVFIFLVYKCNHYIFTMPNCVICLDANDNEDGLTCQNQTPEGVHFICSQCLDLYVASESQEKDITRLRCRRGRILCPNCPKSAADVHLACTSPPFSDQQIALHVSEETWRLFMAAQFRVVNQDTYEETVATLHNTCIKPSNNLSEVIATGVTTVCDMFQQTQTDIKACMEDRILADQLRRLIADPRQCARCHHGPVDSQGCSNLASHHGQLIEGSVRISNACPECGWFSDFRGDWPVWDGTIHRRTSISILMHFLTVSIPSTIEKIGDITNQSFSAFFNQRWSQIHWKSKALVALDLVALLLVSHWIMSRYSPLYVSISLASFPASIHDMQLVSDCKILCGLLATAMQHMWIALCQCTHVLRTILGHIIPYYITLVDYACGMLVNVVKLVLSNFIALAIFTVGALVDAVVKLLHILVPNFIALVNYTCGMTVDAVVKLPSVVVPNFIALVNYTCGMAVDAVG
jgi:hypothetical protein